MRILQRLITSARSGWGTAQRTWAAGAIADDRARAQRLRLAEMTEAELLKASTAWGGHVCHAEIKRRGLGVEA